MPSISVCLPTYNNIGYVKRSVDSILAQTFQDFELVISDGHSTDGTCDVLKGYAQRDARVRLYQTVSKTSIYENWKYAFYKAGGEFIKLHCADDYLEPDFLERAIQELRDQPDKDFVVCKVKPLFELLDESLLNRQRIEHHFDQVVPSNLMYFLSIQDKEERCRQVLLRNCQASSFGCLSGLLFHRKCLPLERWRLIERGMPVTSMDWDILIRLYSEHDGIFLNFIGEHYSYNPKSHTVEMIGSGDITWEIMHFLMPFTILTDPTLARHRQGLNGEEIKYLAALATSSLHQLIQRQAVRPFLEAEEDGSVQTSDSFRNANSKILITTNLYPPQELGGYGRSLADFADSLKARGHQIHVLTGNAPYLGPAPLQEEGVDRRLHLWGTYEGQTQALQDPNQINEIIRHNDRVLREVIAQVQPDLCLVGNISFLGPEVFGPLLENGIPTIHHLGFAQPPYAPHEAPRHPLYHLATASDAVAQAVRDAGLGQIETSTIYPGALVRHYSRPTLPARDKLRILYAGLVIQTKGAHTLLEALSILQQQQIDFECTIAGNAIHADYLTAVQQYLQRTGLMDRVRLVGHLERSQLADCFAQHNVFVFPSIQPEAFGIVQVEAMAAGLTVLSTGVGGASEVIEHGLSGLQFPPGDAAALAQALLSLPQDPDRWAHLAANGQAQAFAKFDIERSVDQLELKFEELLRRKAELSSPMVSTAPATPAADPYVQWLCDRLNKVVEVYKLNPSDPSTIALLRELRRQCAEFWQAVSPEQLQSLYQGAPGQAYRSLLTSGFQGHPLAETETAYLQTLAQQAAQQSLQSPESTRAFLGVMLYLPAGKMKVEQAHAKLPAWLLPDYQAVFESPEALAVIAQHQPTPSSAPAPVAAPTNLAEDMVFLNRMLGCANLYYIDPDEPSIVEELRQIRRQVAEFWLSVPGDRVEAVFNSEFGNRYRALLQCGFQNEPLQDEETAFVQALSQRVAAGLEQPDGIKAFLGVMLYYPPGKMQVRDAQTRLPAWLWPDYRTVFEVTRSEPLVPGTVPTSEPVPTQTASPVVTAPPPIAPPPTNALEKLEDMVFLNRLLGLTNLYEIDPTDTAIAAELREMRSQVTQLWLSVPDDRLEAVFNSEFGRRYGSYLRCGFQREALTPEETQTLQQLAQQVATGLEKPAGLRAFLGAMMYYPPGKMKVGNADQRLPAWLLPTYRAVFEEGATLPA